MIPLDHEATGLPALPDLDFILVRGRGRQNEPARVIAKLIERNARALQLVRRDGLAPSG